MTIRGGFRTDSELSPSDDLTVTGDLYDGRVGDINGEVEFIASPAVQTAFSESNLGGGFIQADWNHRYSDRSDPSLQVSFDRYRRDSDLHAARNTLDVDFDHHIRWGERQDILWGVGYRYSSSTSDGDLFFSLNPANLNTQLFSPFMQDEFALIPDKLPVTVGTKIEHNYYTGFGIMPTVRAMWALHEHQMVWAAISRPLRTTSSLDTASNLTVNGFVPPGGPPVLVRIVGNPAFQNEELVAYEAGYRTQPFERLSVDVAAYSNSYNQLQSTEPQPPFFETTPAPPHIVMPLVYENLMNGETSGLKMFANWKVTDRWTLTPGYAFQEIHLHVDPASEDTTTVPETEGSTPEHWARVDSHLSPAHDVAWDASANFVVRLSDPNVASYTRVDTQLSWRLGENLSASLVGQNLVRNVHVEFISDQGTGDTNFIKRSAYARLS
ncbi:MAG: TonB-dependent receptor [Candidatus Acidiferrales bacterium]